MARQNHVPAFDDIETVRDPDGIVGVISRRRSNGNYSFALMKEFERDGSTERTAFMQRRHIPACNRVLAILEEKMDTLLDQQLASERAAAADRDGRR